MEREIRRVWALADRDGSGKLDEGEIRTLITHLTGAATTATEFRAIMSKLDTDRNGWVSFDEFYVAMACHLGGADVAAAASDAPPQATEGRVAAAIRMDDNASRDAGGTTPSPALHGAAQRLLAVPEGREAVAAVAGALRSPESIRGMQSHIAQFFEMLVAAAPNAGGADFLAAAKKSARSRSSASVASGGGSSSDEGLNSAGLESHCPIDGANGLFSRELPVHPVLAAGLPAVTPHARVAAVAVAEAISGALPSIDAYLRSSAITDVRQWLVAVRALRLMLGVRDYYCDPALPLQPALRAAIVGYYDRVAQLGTVLPLLALMHPRAPADARVTGAITEAAVAAAYTAASAAGEFAAGGAGVAGGADGSPAGVGFKRNRPDYCAAGDDGEEDGGDEAACDGHSAAIRANRASKRRALLQVCAGEHAQQAAAHPALGQYQPSPASQALLPPLLQAVPCIHPAAAPPPGASGIPQPLSALAVPCDSGTWATLQVEVMATLTYFVRGPCLPHTPLDSHWHPRNATRNAKGLIFRSRGTESVLHALVTAGDPAVAQAAAVLLAALAAHSRNCHLLVAVQMRTALALLARIVDYDYRLDDATARATTIAPAGWGAVVAAAAAAAGGSLGLPPLVLEAVASPSGLAESAFLGHHDAPPTSVDAASVAAHALALAAGAHLCRPAPTATEGVEVLFSSLCVMAGGATLPPDIVSLEHLSSSMGGVDLLRSLAAAIAAPLPSDALGGPLTAIPGAGTDGSRGTMFRDEVSCVRMRGLGASALAALLPLLDPAAEGVWAFMCPAIAALAAGAAASVAAVESIAAEIARLDLADAFDAAAAPTAPRCDNATSSLRDLLRLLETHAAAADACLRCLRFLVISTDAHKEARVFLRDIAVRSASAAQELAAEAAARVQTGADAEAAAALLSHCDGALVSASLFVLVGSGNGALHTALAALTGPVAAFALRTNAWAAAGAAAASTTREMLCSRAATAVSSNPLFRGGSAAAVASAVTSTLAALLPAASSEESQNDGYNASGAVLRAGHVGASVAPQSEIQRRVVGVCRALVCASLALLATATRHSGHGRLIVNRPGAVSGVLAALRDDVAAAEAVAAAQRAAASRSAAAPADGVLAPRGALALAASSAAVSELRERAVAVLRTWATLPALQGNRAALAREPGQSDDTFASVLAALSRSVPLAVLYHPEPIFRTLCVALVAHCSHTDDALVAHYSGGDGASMGGAGISLYSFELLRDACGALHGLVAEADAAMRRVAAIVESVPDHGGAEGRIVAAEAGRIAVASLKSMFQWSHDWGVHPASVQTTTELFNLYSPASPAIADGAAALVPALRAVVCACYEDRRRTLPLQLQELSPPQVRQALSGVDGMRRVLWKSKPEAMPLGVDPARVQAEEISSRVLESLESLLQAVAGLVQTAKAIPPAVNPAPFGLNEGTVCDLDGATAAAQASVACLRAEAAVSERYLFSLAKALHGGASAATASAFAAGGLVQAQQQLDAQAAGAGGTGSGFLLGKPHGEYFDVLSSLHAAAAAEAGAGSSGTGLLLKRLVLGSSASSAVLDSAAAVGEAPAEVTVAVEVAPGHGVPPGGPHRTLTFSLCARSNQPRLLAAVRVAYAFAGAQIGFLRHFAPDRDDPVAIAAAEATGAFLPFQKFQPGFGVGVAAAPQFVFEVIANEASLWACLRLLEETRPFSASSALHLVAFDPRLKTPTAARLTGTVAALTLERAVAAARAHAGMPAAAVAEPAPTVASARYAAAMLMAARPVAPAAGAAAGAFGFGGAVDAAAVEGGTGLLQTGKDTAPFAQGVALLAAAHGVDRIAVDAASLDRIDRAFVAKAAGGDAGVACELTEGEFVAAMAHEPEGAAAAGSAPSSAVPWLQSLFALMDRDHSGTVSHQEMAAGLTTLLSGTYMQRMERAFRAFDLDANGTISRDEFARLFGGATGLPAGSALIEANAVFDRFDVDGSGALDFGEFVACVGGSRLSSSFWSDEE